MMPRTPSITCKTVQLHANSPVKRLEVELKVTTGIRLVLIGLLWYEEWMQKKKKKDGDADFRLHWAEDRENV